MRDADQVSETGPLFVVTMAACLAFWIAVGLLALVLVRTLS